jgi:hypothetical protein
MNEKLRQELVKEAEMILYGFHNANDVNAFAEGVLGFLKAHAPVEHMADVQVYSFNEFGTGY